MKHSIDQYHNPPRIEFVQQPPGYDERPEIIEEKRNFALWYLGKKEGDPLTEEEQIELERIQRHIRVH